ncbi:probable L-type lectin-domain containing receptor kinase S.5 [Cajanus cajan]|uniref:non-specific serine/threonine protein kinase n=1 Tax=Cajanus cajan TaxID=3821 RepID=A0A151QZM0_CAJCA|nr:probable L-type lectin-domain containing receptor kinase S.5 [Cajanus cajan]KYP35808.1 Lectin-domain containing receptor kinase A4.2 [Cajanus cajan]
MHLPWLVKYQLAATIFVIVALTNVTCLYFNFTTFKPEDEARLLLNQNSKIYLDVIQVTPDIRGPISNYSGRVFYREQLKLWDRERGMKSSFNSTFVFSVVPVTSPGGEGFAFILTDDASLQINSGGQWLGIVNSTSIGVTNIVAVEFDTRKSYPEDINDNHVGVDVKSIYSIKQEPLGPHGVNISSGTNVVATIYFDANEGKMTIFVSTSGDLKLRTPVLTVERDLSELLPEDIYVGFSASTGEYTQINAIRSWNFSSWEEYIEKNPKNLTWLWILIPIIVVGGACGLAAISYWKKVNKKKHGMEEDLHVELEIKSSSNAPHKFQLKELLAATRNFHSSNKLGKGGFGMVYKGTINGIDVAVKRISKNSRHGKQDFIAEITTIGNLNHKNLVKLIGWCYEKGEILLVYELMQNGSLDRFIFSKSGGDLTLSWERRLSVIRGVSRALDYLHNGCDKRVLHRDIKPSNVMLDSNFNARIGDFGLARTIHLSEKSHHSTREIAGTPGYMAPESLHTRRASVETDVYAFGILILEVVCGGRKGEHIQDLRCCNSIVDWVWELHGRENITDAVDLRLSGDFDEAQAKCVLELGLACSHPNPYERPSMRTVLQVLIGEAAPPFVPFEKPAFTWPATAPVFNEEMNYHVTVSQNEPITELTSGR